MIAIPIEKVALIQEYYSDSIDKQRRKALKELYLIDDSLFSFEEKIYLKKVRRLFKKKRFLQLTPDKLALFTETKSDWLLPANSRGNNKSLKSYILDALDYKSKRSGFYPGYFQKIGIKACVYCNSQYTITAKKTNNKLSAKFDVDHYHSKDEYPFLSISLFNLYPACAPCNRAKSKGSIVFNLYAKKSDCVDSEFEFRLSPDSRAKFLVTKNPADLKVQFKDSKNTKNPGRANEFNNRFAIEGIHNTQNDVIEELIVKSQIYNQAYQKSLKKAFSGLSLDPALFERIILGNYAKDSDIHKRPIAKFTQDIARQLGLIP